MDYSIYFWDFYYFVIDLANNILTKFVPLLFEPFKDLRDLILDNDVTQATLGWLFDLLASTPLGELTPSTIFAGSIFGYVIIRSILNFIKP